MPGPSLDPARARRIRALFAATIALFVAQVLFVHRAEEPYPALTMPEFAGTVADESGVYHTSSAEIRVDFTTGDPAWTTPRELLADVPAGTVMPIVHWMFRPPQPPAERPRSSWRASVQDDLLPGWGIRRNPPRDRPPDPATIRWLRERADRLFAGRTARRIVFEWYRDAYRVSGGAVQRTRQPIGRHEVGLLDGD